MKKQSIFLVILVLFLGNTLHSQTYSLGIKANVGLSNQSGIGNSRLSYSAAIVNHLELNPKFGIQLDLGYGARGMQMQSQKFNTIHETYSFKYALRMHYGQASLLGTFRPSEKISFGFGPYLGFLLNAQSKLEEAWSDAGVKGNSASSDDETALYFWADLGLQLELSYFFTPKLFANFQLQQGLRNTYSLHLFSQKQFNQNYALGLGIFLF